MWARGSIVGRRLAAGNEQGSIALGVRAGLRPGRRPVGCPALVQTAGRELAALQRDARILHASATGRRDVANPSPLAERAWE
jgi:hypothetical protein